MRRQREGDMKAYKITILVLDHDEIGRDGIVNAVERTKYPNRCIAPSVQDIEEAEIGEWHDDHAMNHHSTRRGEYQRIFAPAPGEGAEGARPAVDAEESAA